MMKATDKHAALSIVQRALGAFLVPAGFTAHGRTCRRTTEDRLVQVINLQAGRPAPHSRSVTGLVQTDRGGTFTVNLGVYLPEVASLRGLPAPHAGIKEYDCQVRARLGELLNPATTSWWSLDAVPTIIAAEITVHLQSCGLPFLDRYRTREDVVASWATDARNLSLAHDARVTVALQLLALGREAAATTMLQAQYEGARDQPQHRTWIRELAQRLHIELNTGSD